MPFAACHIQHIQHSRPQTEFRILCNSHALCDIIRDPESDTGNILRQLIWIAAQDIINFISICIEDANCQIHRNSILCQKNGNLLKFLLLHVRSSNRLCLSLGNSADLRKTFWFLLDDPKGVILEFLDDLLRQNGANALDDTRA